MRVLFKQAACILGNDYSRGQHEVSKKVSKSKFFLKLVKAGLVLDADELKLIRPESFEERQMRLAAKILATTAQNNPPSYSPDAELSGAPALGSGDQAPDAAESGVMASILAAPESDESEAVKEAEAVDEAAPSDEPCEPEEIVVDNKPKPKAEQFKKNKHGRR